MSTIICPFCNETTDSPVWSTECKPCNVLLFPKVYKNGSIGVDPIYFYVDLKVKYRVELHYEANYMIVTRESQVPSWTSVYSVKHIPPYITPTTIKDKLKTWLTFL